MVCIQKRTIAGFCLTVLLTSSCGSADEAGESASDVNDMTAAADTVPESVSNGDSEYFSAAHILITWSTSPEDSMSFEERDALRVIRNIQNEVLAGETAFEELAYNHSHCTSAADSGRLPDFTAGGIAEELDSTVSALQPGEISGIIRTRFGFHLVKRLSS
ncbi:MAG: peptidylprolyl isomerase [Candidatus Fermentibacteria bacterium]